MSAVFYDLFFKTVHNHRLIYNTCWEDPRVDRQLLRIDTESRIVVITSAGCNALDYLLEDPAQIHAVDMNPRQNALLHLKLAMIERGVYEDFFKMFGIGFHEAVFNVYRSVKSRLPLYAADFWDRKIAYFSDRSRFRKSFYYRGTTGEVAYVFLNYLFAVKNELRPLVYALLDAPDLPAQRKIYGRIEPLLWGGITEWIARQPALMAMVGVPRAQSRLVRRFYPRGLTGFIQDRFRHVFTRLPIQDNYFYRVYLTGRYTQDCCPRYLRPENFGALGARTGKVRIHTATISQFLSQHPGAYSHFVLLDHQDWMARHDPAALVEEWRLIFQNSKKGARVLMRSAGPDLGFLPSAVRSSVRFRPDLADPLLGKDRTGTYGSLHLAEIL